MSDKYIVLKLTGNWLEQENTLARIKFLLQGLHGVEIKENDLITCKSSKISSKEQLQALMTDSYKDFVKHRIAQEIGEYMLDNGFITFTESDDELASKLTGTLTVLST